MNDSKFISTRNTVKDNMLDKHMYLDTNAIINFLNAENDKIYIKNLIEFIQHGLNKGVNFYYSQHGIKELTVKVHKEIQNNKKAELGLANIKTMNHKLQKEISAESIKLVRTYEKKIDEFAYKIDYDYKYVENISINIFENSGISIPDAEHLAIAQYNGIKSIVTDDADFLCTNGYNIYGSSSRIHEESKKNQNTIFISNIRNETN